MNKTDIALLGAILKGASMREMMDPDGLQSTSAVSYRLGLLAAAGLIVQEKGKARSRSLTAAGYRALADPDSVTVGATRPRRSVLTGKRYEPWERELVREMRSAGATYAAIAGALTAKGSARTMQSVHSWCVRNGIK